MEVGPLANEKDSITLEDEQVYDQALLDKLLFENHIDEFRKEFLAMHTYEQSEYFEDSDEEIRQRIFEVLSPEEVADFFEQLEIDEDEYESLFDTMDAEYASKVLEDMSYDNAVDIMNKLSKQKIVSLLTLMKREDAKEIKALLHYEEDTAGGIMTTEYISLKATMPVKEAMMHVKEQAPDAESFVTRERPVQTISGSGNISPTPLPAPHNLRFSWSVKSDKRCFLTS